MHKASELIGKNVISLTDAAEIGVVANLYFDSKMTKLRFFRILDENSDEEFFAPFKEIVSAQYDAIVLRGSDALAPDADAIPSPINLPAFNQDGLRLGVIRDVALDGENVSGFFTENGEISGSFVCSSDKLAVFNDSGKPLKLKKPATKPQKEITEQVAAPREIASATSPLNKYAFLLGKRLQKSIYTRGGAVIAKENQLIDENVISTAKSEGKLVALALHSL